MILLSIVTITRNNLEGLRTTLASCQPLIAREDVELVIIDGASNDGSVDMLKRWRTERPAAHCILLSEPDLGIYHAMNKGLRLACGRHVVFMNSGDQFSPEFKMDPTALTKGSIHYGHARFESALGDFRKVYRIEGIRSFLNHNPWCHQAVYYPRELILALGGYDTSYRVSADFDLTLRSFLQAPFVPLNQVACICDLGGFSYVHGIRSYLERMRSLRLHAGLGWWFLLAAYLPIFYFKHQVVRFLEGSRLLTWYRQFRYR